MNFFKRVNQFYIIFAFAILVFCSCSNYSKQHKHSGNENGEGAWLTPTKSEGNARLETVKIVIGEEIIK